MRNTAVAVNDGLRYILISSNNKFALDEVKVWKIHGKKFH